MQNVQSKTVRETHEPHPDWWNYPVVSEAVQRLDSHGRLTALDLLEAVRSTLDGLEERFPGVPFRQILSCQPAEKPEVRKAMRSAGCDEGDINLVLGPESRTTTRGSKYSTPSWFERIRAGVRYSDLLEEGHSPSIANLISSARSPFTETQRAIVALRATMPTAGAEELARQAGVTKHTARKAMLKAEYQQWLESLTDLPVAA